MSEESACQSSNTSIGQNDQTITDEKANGEQLNESNQTTSVYTPQQAIIIPTTMTTTNATNSSTTPLFINSQIPTGYYQPAPYIPLQSPSFIYSQVPTQSYANVPIWDQQQQQQSPQMATFDTYFNYYLVPLSNSGATAAYNILPNSVYYNPSNQSLGNNSKHNNNTQSSLSSNCSSSSNNTSRKNSYSNEYTKTKPKLHKTKKPNRQIASGNNTNQLDDESVFVNEATNKSVLNENQNGTPRVKKYSEVVASGETNKSNESQKRESRSSNSSNSTPKSATVHVNDLISSQVNTETHEKTRNHKNMASSTFRSNFNTYESYIMADNYAYYPVDQLSPFLVNEFVNLNLYSPNNPSSSQTNGQTMPIISQPVPIWDYNYATALATAYQKSYKMNGFNRRKAKHESTYQANGISDINPSEFYFNGEREGVSNRARFFVIKSYSKEDVVLSVKHGYWCSTESGNAKLNQAFDEAKATYGSVYLLFSINSSGEFCGLAEMSSNVDLSSNLEIWSQSKWKGKFSVKWIYVKNVPNSRFRHIVLANNDNKPVTNSRDTQEIPFEQAVQVLNIYRDFRHKSTILDDEKSEQTQSFAASTTSNSKKKQQQQQTQDEAHSHSFRKS